MDESADASAQAIAVAGALRGLRRHLVDQGAAFAGQQLTDAVLLRIEELVEGRLGGSGRSHDLVDGRLVVAAVGQDFERRAQEPAQPCLPALLPAPGADCHRGGADQPAARAREMTSRWISEVPSKSV